MGNQTSCNVKETIDGSKDPLRKFVTSNLRGWRATQEDSHISQNGLGKFKSWSMFGVFDGHAGDYVSEQVGERLINTFLNTEYVKSLNPSRSSRVFYMYLVFKQTQSLPQKTLTDAFRE